MHAFFEDDSKTFWREGKVDDKVHIGVVSACLVTLMLAAIAPTALWRSSHGSLEHKGWYCYSIVAALALCIAVAYVPPFRVTRTLRVALALPVAHLVAVIAAWVMWSASESRLETYVVAPLVTRPALVELVAVLGGTCALAGSLIARRGRGERAQVALVAGLTNLLLLGLWLPIASGLLVDYVDFDSRNMVIVSPLTVIAYVLVPPLACAIAYTALVTRAPRLAARLRFACYGLVGTALAIAMIVRVGPSWCGSAFYGSFVPALLAAIIVAVAALVAASIAAWPRRRRTRDALSGVIASDDASVGGFVVTSWLRGPTPTTKPFTLVTPRGPVPVPAGIALDVPLPISSTLLSPGEGVAVVRPGDAVAISGFVAAEPGDHPFREAAAPQPGPNGLVLALQDPPRPDLAQVALVTWRPCVAYLAIIFLIGLPALAGALVVR